MTNDDAAPPRARRPAGAAVMQPQVTDAIARAMFAELAEVGYGRLSMEAVARRAGVSKPTVYRRWASKQAMVSSLVSQVATAAADTPDTGTIRGDLRAFLAALADGLRHPLAVKIIPDLFAEANRSPDLTEQLLTEIRDVRREKAADLLRRGIARGELPDDLDIALAVDMLGGPLYWRLVLVRAPTEPDYLDRLTDMLLTAFGRPPATR